MPTVNLFLRNGNFHHEKDGPDYDGLVGYTRSCWHRPEFCQWSITTDDRTDPPTSDNRDRPVWGKTYSHNKCPHANPDLDTEVQDDPVPQALKDVGEHGERVYDMAKVADWTQAQAELAALQQAAYQLNQVPSHSSAIRSLINTLDQSLVQLSQVVAAKNQQATQRLANQVTWLATQMTQQYPTTVPVEVTLLDYYGRQLEVDAASGSVAQLQATAHQLEQTWTTVRPAIVGHGGTPQAQQFDALVAQVSQAKTAGDYSQLVTPILDQVDQLEAVFQ